MSDPKPLPSLAQAGENERSPDFFALLAPAGAPVLMDSSPHMISFAAFARLFGGSPRRRELLAALDSELRLLKEQGVDPLCLLVGGGFVRDGASPGDLDALVAYALAPGSTVDVTRLLAGRDTGDLDLRFVPGDVGPLLLMKMSCFFHTLYQSRDRGGDQASFIVTIGR